MPIWCTHIALHYKLGWEQLRSASQLWWPWNNWHWLTHCAFHCIALLYLALPCIGLHNNSAWNNCPPCSPDGMLAFLLTVPYMLDTSSTLCFSVNGKLVKYQVGCLSPRKYIMMVGICKGSPEESTKVLLKVPPEGRRVRRKTRVKVPERSECGIRP